MEKLKLLIENAPAQADLDVIERGLAEHGEFKSEPRNYQPLAVFLRDEESNIVGGLRGATVWGWLFVSQLWVSEELRGKGCGRQLMETAENEAKARNCVRAHLDTFSFQALDFYLNLGYEVFGKLEDFPKGHTRYFLKKNLS